jgi:hypothetical protein
MINLFWVYPQGSHRASPALTQISEGTASLVRRSSLTKGCIGGSGEDEDTPLQVPRDHQRYHVPLNDHAEGQAEFQPFRHTSGMKSSSGLKYGLTAYTTGSPAMRSISDHNALGKVYFIAAN